MSKKLLLFIILTILIASPFLYRTFLIHEIYLYPEVRDGTLDSIFFLRENLGLTIADLTINNIEIKENELFITVHEKYHGLINIEEYNDLEQYYYLKYNFEEKETLLLKNIK